MIGGTFTLVGQMDYERVDDNIPTEIPVLRYQDLVVIWKFTEVYRDL